MEKGLSNQAQTLEHTLDAYTTGGAYLEFAETQKGQLKEGMLADIVVLNKNIFKVDPKQSKMCKLI